MLFPAGPDGGHELINRTDEEMRLLLVSNFAVPSAAVQIDSDKIMVRWGSQPDERLWFRRDEAVDYRDREPLAES